MTTPNTLQVQVKDPLLSWGKLATANTAKDGTGTVLTIFTAGANNARADRIKVRSLGTNVATVLRIFINNGSDPTVATNNSLYMEATIAATTLSEASAQVDNVIDLATLAMPAGYKLTATIGTTLAAGLAITAEGGNF